MEERLTTETTEVERADRTMNPRQNTYLPYPPLPVAAMPEVSGLEEAGIGVTTASNSKVEPGGARELVFEAIIGSPLQTVGPQDLVPADADSIAAAELTVAVVAPIEVAVVAQVAAVPIPSAAAVVGVVVHVVAVTAVAAEAVFVVSVPHPVASAVALADVDVVLSLAPAVAAG